jgi:hypothetical protein
MVSLVRLLCAAAFADGAKAHYPRVVRLLAGRPAARIERGQGRIAVQNRYYKLAILAAVSTLFANTASAGPPASCACKFVGVWSHSAGTTTINADGTAKPNCVVTCVALQTWTCEGNTIIMRNPGEFTGTLIDANHIKGATWTSTRISGGSCSPSNRKPPAAERCSRPPARAGNTNE